MYVYYFKRDTCKLMLNQRHYSTKGLFYTRTPAIYQRINIMNDRRKTHESINSSAICEENNEEFSHNELVKLTQEAIDKIIETDPLFFGLPSDVTVEELKSQIAVAQGQAITLYLNRGELPKLSIVVSPHNTTVLDLKKAIKRQTTLALHREGIKKKISWRHIWKKYHLCYNDIILNNDKENIKNYGISNKIELKYVKRRREKNRI